MRGLSVTDGGTGPGSTVARRQLGRLLREARLEARLTVKAASVALEWGETKTWKIETGQASLRTHDVEAICRVYGVPPERTAVLADLAKQTKQEGWWQDRGPAAVSPTFDLYIGLEGAASELNVYASELVPGLLQTPDYARALIASGRHGADPAVVERSVELRMARQRLLTRVTAAPTLVVVLSEAVLRRPVGGRQVMAAQLARLIEVSGLPNVTMHVVPFSFGLHPGLISGPFVILRFPSAVEGRDTEPPVVYVDGYTGCLYLDKPHEIEQYDAAFADMLHTIDNDTARSAGFLREAARELHG